MTMRGMRASVAHENLQSCESQAGMIEIGKDMEKLALLAAERPPEVPPLGAEIS